MSQVTIADVQVRTSKTDGREFLSLTICGDLDIITTKTGNQSLVAMKCNISSNLPISMADSLIGKTIEGTVVKVPCAAYSWTNPRTAEVVELSHTYRYQKTAFHTPTGENAPIKNGQSAGISAASPVSQQNAKELRMKELQTMPKLNAAEKKELAALLTE